MISKTLAFSKKEARGTFVLIILVFIALGTSTAIKSSLRNSSELPYDSMALSNWVAEVEASYEIKKKKGQEIIKYAEVSRSSEASFTPIVKPSKINSEGVNRKEKIEILDLNTASAEDLKRVKGIGKIFSGRIVKYRNRLGGFNSLKQLTEVYGVKSELLKEVEAHFSIQSSVDTFNINSDSVKALIKHPYISYDQAWVIINFRKQHGDISNFDELSKIKALNDSLLNKLRPYIK